MKNFTLFILLFSYNLIFAQNIEDGLLLHYKFDNDFKDSSQNEYDGENYGATFTEDRLGNENSAISFDGIDNYIEFPNLTELKPELPVSFSFWVKYDSSDGNYAYLLNTSFEYNRSSGIYFNTQLTTGKYAINYGDGTYFFSPDTRRTYISETVSDTINWHHVAIVVNSESDMKIYVDCIEKGGEYVGDGGDLIYSERAGNLGRGRRNANAGISYFKGAIDDFYYWDRELSDREIEKLCSFNPMNVEDFVPNKTFIAPNPAKAFIEINTSLKNIKNYSIHSIDGKIVMSGEYKTSKIDIRNLTSGIYFIKIYSDKNREVLKFIKQ